MTPESEALLRAVLRRDFASFIAKSFQTLHPSAEYLSNWHIDLIAEYLEAARRGELQRLIINMPPRSLKSHCVSVAWPAWLLGHDPSTHVLSASYSKILSVGHASDCRQLLQAPWYKELFPLTCLARGQNEKQRFATTRHGLMYASSVGGSITGEGGNYLLLDDPLSPAQASVRKYREYVNRWFDQTFASRLDDKRKGVIVLVMQRLQQEDLSEYLLAKGGWEHVCLPAVAPETTIYHFGQFYKWRERGELLHPAREDEALIERARLELGSYAFAAQYQQDPVPLSGNIIKPEWLRYGPAPAAERGRVVQSWDTGIKAGERHDPSVCATFITTGNMHFLAEVKVMRLEYPDLKRAFVAMADAWKPQAILLEDKASGQQLLQDMKRETALPLIGIRPKEDKLTRLVSVSALIEAGRLVLPEDAGWRAAFEAELLHFPHTAHDDQVDTLSQYLRWAQGQEYSRIQIRKM